MLRLPRILLPVFILLVSLSRDIMANIPGGGTGTGGNVTLSSTSTTATMSNGIVSIVITKSSAQIPTINYTFNNSGANQTINLLSGNPNGGKLYWEHSNNQGLDFTNSYTVIADPAANGGDLAHISLRSTTQANMPFEVHYAMRRGSPGFYVAAVFTHGSADGAFSMGECRDNIYAGSIFNWMSVDATRNKLMEVGSATTAPAANSPVENYLWTSGLYKGRYEDKYKYSATFGDQRVWGWSSVGPTGKNVGLWNVIASAEYYNGGPLKPELMCHIGTTILNMINGTHYNMGTDGDFVAGENWSKVCGPYFIYCNNIPGSVTDMQQASQALYADALAQAAAEATAWPYSWFSHPNYAAPSARGTVTGKIVINDTYNPAASAANLWVGLIRQPVTSTGTYDFQQWMKPYQFWVRTDAAGNFTIPAVIAGSNYTLYAFGPGANGTFMSQSQTGGNPPFLKDIPASPFSVTVNAGTTTALGNVTWTPTRVGPTVFEIGYPDRTARKFRHGDDYWVGDVGPDPSTPSPIWSQWLAYPFDFPNGLTYNVGTHRWTTDWNFTQTVVNNTSGGWDSSSSTITFNLAARPANGTLASLYLGLAADYYTALIVTVNGTNLASAPGIVSTPSALPSTGFIPSSSASNSTIREFSNGAFSDQRLTFAGTVLRAGLNTITIAQRQVGGTYFANHAMYDYLRLELTGYIPPAPSSVTAFAGNARNLVSWPVTPGATSYNILRSTVSGSGYTSVATGITGPVCGSGPVNASWTDSAVLNGATYYYVVQSVNPAGVSANSPQSAGATPSSGLAASAPATPNGLSVTAANASASLSWNASAGANFYTVRRSTLVENGAGGLVSLSNITLANNVSANTYTDSSPSNGCLYSYTVSAANAFGESAASAASIVKPVATPPAGAPLTLSITPGAKQITLSWTASPGAIGYLVQQALAPGGPYTYETTLPSRTYTDTGLADNTTYYYVVTPMNSGGVGANSNEAAATTAPATPSGVTITAGNTQATLAWSASVGATSYQVRRSTVAGGPYTTIASGITSSGFTDTGLANGTAYYYVVAALNGTAASAASTEVSATPSASLPLAPTGLASSIVNLRVVLLWSASPGALSYTISRSLSSNGSFSVIASGITATTYTDSTAVSGSSYYYIVTAVNATGPGAASPPVSAIVIPPGLLWTGAASATWDSTASNWLVNGSPSAYLEGGLATFNDSSSVTGITLSGTFSPAAVTVDTAQNYSFSGNGIINGSGNLTKSGNGTLTINSAHSFTGGTTIAGGTLTLGNAAALGNGTVTLAGGTFGTGALTPGNSIVVTADSRITGGHSGGNHGIKAVSGSGNLTLEATSVFDLEGALAGFTGTFLFTGTGSFRLFGSAGSPSADFDLGTRSLTARSGTAFSLGSLSGAPSALLTGSSGSGNTAAVAYTIGANNRNSTFAGTISNGAGATSLVKTGSGALTLSGNCAYTGATTVSAGALHVTGQLGNTTVSVSANATFGGNGSLSGNLTLASGSRLVFGVSSNATSGMIVSGSATLNGNITVSPLYLDGTLSPGTYTILSSAGSIAGAPSFAWSDPAGSSLSASFSTATAGQIRLTLQTPLQVWRQAAFGSSSSSSDLLDADGDGVSNLLEYALGTNPSSAASVSTPSLQSTGTNLQLSFTRLSDPYLTYTVQGSSDLLSWSDVWSGSGVAGPITVTDTAGLAVNPRRFLRLRVTSTSP